jgi:outer membrane protein OmpA-like peptidoglycan-associated protein
MKNYLIYFLLLSGIAGTVNAQSIITGNWTGTLHQNASAGAYKTEYKFSMVLEEKNGEIKGVSTIITAPNFGIMELKGNYANGYVTFEEYKIRQENKVEIFQWCYKAGKLKLITEGAQMRLEGNWTGYAMFGSRKTICSPGSIVITKEVGFISLKGHVVDEKTNSVIPAHIKIINITTGKEEAKITTNTGDFDIKLPGSNKYELTVESQGYLTRHEQVDLVSSKILNIPLNQIEVGQKVALKNVLFERSTADLMSNSFPELDRLYKFLKENSTVTIELDGHTSNEGSSDKNIELSEKRVIAIKKFLTDKDILASRINTKAFGAQHPIAPNDTEDNRKLNRRVEFVILSK